MMKRPAADTQCSRSRDRAPARSRPLRPAGPLAQRHGPSRLPAIYPSTCCSGSSPTGCRPTPSAICDKATRPLLDTLGQGRGLSQVTSEPLALPGAGALPPGHAAGAGVGRRPASGDGAGRRLCLEWRNLSQPLAGGPRHHRHPLERAALLRVGKAGGGRADEAGAPASGMRCAIYTRVSTDHGLEQDFNSLDAQREAAEAYIKSQAHEGWIADPDSL